MSLNLPLESLWYEVATWARCTVCCDAELLTNVYLSSWKCYSKRISYATFNFEMKWNKIPDLNWVPMGLTVSESDI